MIGYIKALCADWQAGPFDLDKAETWQEAVENWLRERGDLKYKLPKGTRVLPLPK